MQNAPAIQAVGRISLDVCTKVMTDTLYLILAGEEFSYKHYDFLVGEKMGLNNLLTLSRTIFGHSVGTPALPRGDSHQTSPRGAQQIPLDSPNPVTAAGKRLGTGQGWEGWAGQRR